LSEYYSVVEATGAQRSLSNFKFYLSYLFNGVSFAGKRVLDIGAGSGYMGFYAACRGAKEVVCLEPEESGANAQLNEAFSQFQSRLPAANVERISQTIQDSDLENTFDIILMHNSINHVIAGCPTLRRDTSLQKEASRIFAKIFNKCENGADFLIVDNSRYHAFQLLRMKHPLSPHVGWRHHETPAFWMSLLKPVGFEKRQLCWGSLNTFGTPGRLLMNNPLAAYIVGMPFILTVGKREQP
jgi:SAM-dependent methyltransferase